MIAYWCVLSVCVLKESHNSSLSEWFHVGQTVIGQCFICSTMHVYVNIGR